MSEQFDPNIAGLMEGQVGNVIIKSPAGWPGSPPAVSNRVVDPAQDFSVTVSWTVFGHLVPLWMAALKGSWRIDVYAESMGAGPEKRIGGTTVSTSVFGPDPANRLHGRTYTATVTVPAGTLTEHTGTESGIYRLALAMFLDSSLGLSGYDLIGFSDGPLIQVEGPV